MSLADVETYPNGSHHLKKDVYDGRNAANGDLVTMEELLAQMPRVFDTQMSLDDKVVCYHLNRGDVQELFTSHPDLIARAQIMLPEMLQILRNSKLP